MVLYLSERNASSGEGLVGMCLVIVLMAIAVAILGLFWRHILLVLLVLALILLVSRFLRSRWGGTERSIGQLSYGKAMKALLPIPRFHWGQIPSHQRAI